MKGHKQEQLLVAILICALLVAAPHVFNAFTSRAMLTRFVKRGDMAKVRGLLNSKPALLNAADKKTGATPLFWAVIADQAKMAELLLERGANVNAKDKHGLTPLHKAVSFNRPAMIELLARHGADPEARGVKYNALFMTPLHLAAEAGFAEVAEALIAARADVNSCTDGANSVTPLHIAATRGHHAVARLLLENGADVNARDTAGLTPLSWARKSGRLQLDELLRVYDGNE